LNYWLVKTEPLEYSYDDLVKAGIGRWDGVRNFQARNYMKAMQKGDKVFIYHSVQQKAIVGLAQVVNPAYPDPGDETGKWVAVDLKAVEKFPRMLTLEEIKANPGFENMPLLKQSRLSVMPVESAYVDLIFGIAKERL
jgi:predicted RNA-binding protein with PUA-like domain